MRFIALSDSHDNIYAVRDLMEEIKNERADFFVHAGDVISPFALREFKGLERLYLSFGNNDGDRQKLMEIGVDRGWVMGDVVTVGDVAVYHGTSMDILKILTRRYRVVVYGHTHESKVSREGDRLVVNPGEVCGYLSGKRSFAIYEDGEVSIVEF